MRTHSRLGRTVVFTCSAGLVSVLAMLPSGSAFATVTGSFQTAGSSSSSPISTNTCTLVAGAAEGMSPVKAVVGGKVTTATNLNATYESSADSSDLTTVTGHYQGVLKVAKSQGDLSSMSLTGIGDVSVHRAEGNASLCRTQAILGSEIQPLSFTESHNGWLVYHRIGTAKNQVAELEVANSDVTSGLIIDIYQGGPSSADGRAFATAGSYMGVALVASVVNQVALKSVPRMSVSLAFYKTGAAPSATSGSGKKFVRFPASVSCGGHSARLSFTGKIGHVAGGSFFVNGHKKRSVSNPHAGGHVTLHHLSSKADTTITAKLSLKGGGHASATRTYLPCQG
jgi:hypothetical protein